MKEYGEYTLDNKYRHVSNNQYACNEVNNKLIVLIFTLIKLLLKPHYGYGVAHLITIISKSHFYTYTSLLCDTL